MSDRLAAPLAGVFVLLEYASLPEKRPASGAAKQDIKKFPSSVRTLRKSNIPTADHSLSITMHSVSNGKYAIEKKNSCLASARPRLMAQMTPKAVYAIPIAKAAIM